MLTKVKKDVLIALVIGFSIGAVIAIFAVKLPSFFEQNQKTEKTVKKEESTPTVITQKETTIPRRGILQISEGKNIKGRGHY